MVLFQILDEVEKRRGISPALVQPLMRSVMEAPFPALGRTITVKNFLPGSGTEVKTLAWREGGRESQGSSWCSAGNWKLGLCHSTGGVQEGRMVWQFRGRELRSKIGEQRGWHGEFSSDLGIKKEVTVKVKVETHSPRGRMKQDMVLRPVATDWQAPCCLARDLGSAQGPPRLIP